MVSDLRQRVPGHSLIDELLHQWDIGAIHLGERVDEVIIDDEAVGWYRGVIGERRIAAVLGQLDDEWTVLNSVPVGSGTTDIDHIAIGPAGVFTINTKYSPGRNVWAAGTSMKVNGRSQRYVHNSIREVIRAAGALQRASGLAVPVNGVIVFVDPERITTRGDVGDKSHEIRVVSDRELLATLRGPATLAPREVGQVIDAAIRPETWHQSPKPSTIGRHIEREFLALAEAVGPRLAAPVTRAPTQRTPKRPAPRTRPASRRRGRRKQSRLEKLLGILFSLVGFVIFWQLLSTYLAQR